MGIIYNWITTYPGAVDSTALGGSMQTLVDNTYELLASHPNALANAVIAIEGENTNIKKGSINVAVDGEQTGTAAKFIGAVRVLNGGKAPVVRTLIGCIDVTKSATLEIRRFATGITITTLGGVAGGLAERTATNISFPAADWYGFYLYGGDGTTVSVCKGVNIELPV